MPVIAVLPFDNMSGDPAQIYFTEGMTDKVITELSRFHELMVIARNSSFAFRGKSIDLREVGRQLGAANVVQGSVRQAGDRIRITAQLVEAATGTHLWADRYDRSIEDVFAIQEEIAQDIVAAVAQRVREEARWRPGVVRRRTFELMISTSRVTISRIIGRRKPRLASRCCSRRPAASTRLSPGPLRALSTCT
jgi:TolB-like protein